LVRWRPLVPVSIHGPSGLVRQFSRAVMDPAADDTVFPIDTATRIGAVLRPVSGHRVRWRGQLHPLRFGDVELVLEDNGSSCRWPAVVGFSPAPLRYPILGQSSCLQYFDTRFLGIDLILELEINPSFPGKTN
jgi:hypothetical protein